MRLCGVRLGGRSAARGSVDGLTEAFSQEDIGSTASIKLGCAAIAQEGKNWQYSGQKRKVSYVLPVYIGQQDNFKSRLFSQFSRVYLCAKDGCLEHSSSFCSCH